MCVIMAIAALIALRGLKRGVQQDTEATVADREDQLPGDEPGDRYPTFR
jgi:hypothetical protein